MHRLLQLVKTGIWNKSRCHVKDDNKLVLTPIVSFFVVILNSLHLYPRKVLPICKCPKLKVLTCPKFVFSFIYLVHAK